MIDLGEISRRLEELYSRIPEIRCRKKCHGACGPIGLFPAEVARIEAALGMRFPAVDMHTLTCPMLTAGNRCGIYPLRPLVCRLYGAVEQMRCPHGCRPARFMTDEEVLALSEEIAALMPGPSRQTWRP